jgi:predicted nucleotidyltransferase
MKTNRLNELLALLMRKKELLKKNFGVIDLAIFGSYARNQQKKDSDVDIYVQLKQEAKTFDNFMELRFYLEEMLGKKVDLLTKESIREELQQKIFREAVYV